MTGGFLDWLGRVVMLVLAGLVTLSIIGSIAAIPSGNIETRMRLEIEAPGAEPPPLPKAEPQAGEPRARPAQAAGAEGVQDAAGTPPTSGPSEATHWLEAITYALLALVGLAALASLILWRGLRERKRIADAVETLAGRP